jgi:predicted negative regulator of RcsB-dependent stress response
MARKKAVKVEVVEKLSAAKKTINAVKAWLEANGIEGILGLIVGLVLWTLGYKIYAGFAFGVFATRNWDIAKAWVSKLLK